MQKILILLVSLIMFLTTQIVFSATADEVINQAMTLSNITGADDLLSEVQDLVTKFVNDPDDHNGIGVNFTSTRTRFIFFRGSVTSTMAMLIPLVPGNVNDTGTLRGKLAARLKNEVTNFLLNNSYWDWEHNLPSWSPYVTPANSRCTIGYHATYWRNGPHWEKMYALWCYAFYTGDWQTIQNNWSFIKQRYNDGSKAMNGTQRTLFSAGHYRFATNDLANGLIGYTRMAERMGDSTRTQARTEAASALNWASSSERLNVSWNACPLSTNYDGSGVATVRGEWSPGYNLSPEVGRWINENTTARNYAQTRLDEAANAGLLKGHWWCGFLNNFSKNNSEFANEDAWGMESLSSELFLGRAWMLQESAQSLRAVKPWHTVMGDIPEYRDIPYIRCLYALISRHATVNWVQAW